MSLVATPYVGLVDAATTYCESHDVKQSLGSDHIPSNYDILHSMCEHILEHEGEFDSYTDYYEKFIDPDGYHAVNERSRHLKTIWRSIWAYDEYDHLPDGKWFNPVGMSHRSFNKLIPVFRSFVEKEVIPSLRPGQIREMPIIIIKHGAVK